METRLYPLYEEWRIAQYVMLGFKKKENFKFNQEREEVFLSIVMQQESFWGHFKKYSGEATWILQMSLVNKKWRDAVPKFMSARVLTSGVLKSDRSLSARFGLSLHKISCIPPISNNSSLNKFYNSRGRDTYCVFKYVMEVYKGINFKAIDVARKRHLEYNEERAMKRAHSKSSMKYMMRDVYEKQLQETLMKEGIVEKTGMHALQIQNAVYHLIPLPMPNIRFYYYLEKFGKPEIAKMRREFTQIHGHGKGGLDFAIEQMKIQLSGVNFELPFNEIVSSQNG